MQSLVRKWLRKWRKLLPLFFCATATAPLIFTLAPLRRAPLQRGPPQRAPPFSVCASGAVALKVVKCPALTYTRHTFLYETFSYILFTLSRFYDTPIRPSGPAEAKLARSGKDAHRIMWPEKKVLKRELNTFKNWYLLFNGQKNGLTYPWLSAVQDSVIWVTKILQQKLANVCLLIRRQEGREGVEIFWRVIPTYIFQYNGKLYWLMPMQISLDIAQLLRQLSEYYPFHTENSYSSFLVRQSFSSM